MKKQYLLDGKPVTFSQLINEAQELGYDGNGGLLLTSEAAAVLREHGHTVEVNPDA